MSLNVKNIAFVAFMFLLLLDQVYCSEVVVNLSSGKVRGKLSRSLPHGLKARMFLGIPYAEPPIGHLRFSPPVPVKTWSGIRDANKFPSFCPQPAIPWPFPPAGKTSEDCLFLNVFTPLNTKKEKLAVLVYIHGGGFHTMGAADDLSILSSLNDVIVVAVQYRLGALGFFNVPGSTIKGNYGLMDQVESLKWVQKNIAVFGGDPLKVTILGQSAGGISVAMHLLMPQSKNLFRGAIVQSGAANSVPTCYTIRSKKPAKFFLGLLNCSIEGPFLECIRSRSQEEVVAAQIKLMATQNQDMFVTVSPVVDGTYLVDLPRNLLEQQKFDKVPTIFGITSDEGSMLTDMFLKDMPLSMYTEYFFKSFVHSARDLDIGDNKLVKEAIMYQYTNHGVFKSPEVVRKQLATMWGDKFAIAPIALNLESFAKAGVPGHFYIFSHRSKYSVYPPWVGVNHADDLPYTLGAPIKKSLVCR